MRVVQIDPISRKVICVKNVKDDYELREQEYETYSGDIGQLMQPDGKFITLEPTLEEIKKHKITELEKLCENTIIAGFEMEVAGSMYRFSASVEAQSNFIGTDILFKDGLITEAKWTAVESAGNVARVTLDQILFDQAKNALFNHINSNISLLRDTLQPKVEAAMTKEEVATIVW